jgi:AraC-like DNA-binding protein
MCGGPATTARLGCAVSLSSGATVVAPLSELSAGYAYELVELCGRWNVPAAELLEGTGLTLASMREPSSMLSLEACQTLVHRARALTRQPGLAFFMGLQMRLSWHGFLGFASMTARNVREALEIAERFSLTRTAAFGLCTYVEGRQACLVLEERAPLQGSAMRELREFAIIALLVGIAQIARAVTGRTVEGVAECAFPEPDYAGPILARAAEANAGTMRFGQPAHRLLFDASILELPLVTADPVAMELARAQCDRELAALVEKAGLAGRVRAALSTSPEGFRSVEEVARQVHLSTRTLKRKLAAEGTSFTHVLEDVRRQRALLLLDDRDLGVAEIAARLGYSDVANFTRAFRRWTGTTPAALRKGRG